MEPTFWQETGYWLIPLVINIIFAVCNVVTAHENLKIAKNQRDLQNNMFCYQLFEKRMVIYTNIQKTLSDIISAGAANQYHLISFLQCTRDVPFLFGDDIVKLKEDTYNLIGRLHHYSTLVERASGKQVVPENHEENCNMESELLKQISDLQSNLRVHFEPYISFGDYRVKATNEVSK